MKNATSKTMASNHSSNNMNDVNNAPLKKLTDDQLKEMAKNIFAVKS